MSNCSFHVMDTVTFIMASSRQWALVYVKKHCSTTYTSYNHHPHQYPPKSEVALFCANFSNFFDNQSLVSMQPSVAANAKHPTIFCRLQAMIIPVPKTTILIVLISYLLNSPISLRISQRLPDHDPHTVVLYQKKVGMCSICYPNRIINRSGFTYELTVMINVKCPVPCSHQHLWLVVSQSLSCAKRTDYQTFLAPWPCTGTSTHNCNDLHQKFTLVWEGCWMSISNQVFLLVKHKLNAVHLYIYGFLKCQGWPQLSGYAWNSSSKKF